MSFEQSFSEDFEGKAFIYHSSAYSIYFHTHLPLYLYTWVQEKVKLTISKLHYYFTKKLYFFDKKNTDYIINSPSSGLFSFKRNTAEKGKIKDGFLMVKSFIHFRHTFQIQTWEEQKALKEKENGDHHHI